MISIKATFPTKSHAKEVISHLKKDFKIYSSEVYDNKNTKQHLQKENLFFWGKRFLLFMLAGLFMGVLITLMVHLIITGSLSTIEKNEITFASVLLGSTLASLFISTLVFVTSHESHLLINNDDVESRKVIAIIESDKDERENLLNELKKSSSINVATI